MGHTGTLDPFASGLLLLCVGSATRLAEYLGDFPKTYCAVMRLGAATDTDDIAGTVIASDNAWRALDEPALRRALNTQVGEIDQVPPAYSAKKLAGERAYRMARRGETVVLDPVRVTVHAITIVGFRLPDVEFEITCGSGTYIRAIARDIGLCVGSHAHLVSLRRTCIGPHRVETAIPLDCLTDAAAVERAWIPPLEAIAHLPLLRVEPDQATKLLHGAGVMAATSSPEGRVAVVCEDRLVAIAEHHGGLIKPRKVFPE